MLTVTYNPYLHCGNHLFIYNVGRLLAKKLNLAFHADEMNDFPHLETDVAGEVIDGDTHLIEGADPIASWPDVEHLRGKRIEIRMGFVNSRYVLPDRQQIKSWMPRSNFDGVTEDDVL